MSILFWHFLSFRLPFFTRACGSISNLGLTVGCWGASGLALGLLLSGCAGNPTASAPTANPSAQSSATPFLVISPSPSPSKTPGKSQAVKALEQKLKLDLVKKAEIAVQSVECPREVQVEPGKTFDCRATAEGKPFTLTISLADKNLANKNLANKNLTDKNLANKKSSPVNDLEMKTQTAAKSQIFRPDSDGLQWSTKGLLVLPKLEKTIQQGIQEQFGVAVKTQCGGKVRVAKPGDTFTCKLTDGKGERSVTVRVDDEQGNVTWKL
jgi:hypothetical protein